MATDAAFLLVSFGGPEGPDDVMPFLRNVTAGRNVPDDRLAEVGEHYYLFGGVSPINAQCRELAGAIEKDFAASGIDLPVYWGNRNWQPYLAGTLRAMADDGITHAIAFATSAYSSYSSCRQYLDDIDRARAAVGPSAPRVVKIPPYYRHPGFIGSFADAARRALASLPAGGTDGAELVFTAHSIPESMAAASGPAGGAYPAQLAEVAGLVAAELGRTAWRLAYQSRSGPPSARWLGPDISECLTDLAQAGSRAAVVVPIGFVSDHVEVRYDLDVEAAQTAGRLGLAMARAATPGTDPRFVSMISALVRDFAAAGPGDAVDALGPQALTFCREGCCGAGPDRSGGRALAGS
ncbi:MAG TPA: ferrochelatase [Streptosporangiaceae bacterium]|nr:ferrochelatase [Streptosporangiaceae bacterium]